jgi:hypothetical protein
MQHKANQQVGLSIMNEKIEQVFSHFHGRYGSRFLAQFNLGTLDEYGHDKGIANAKAVWAEQLSTLTKTQLMRAKNHNYGDFPPSCDAFMAAAKGAFNASKTPEALAMIAIEQLSRRQRGLEQEWPHSQLFWAAQSMAYDLQNQPYKSLAARWAVALERFENDERPIPKPADNNRSIARHTSAHSQKLASDSLAIIKKRLGMSMAQGQTL